MLTRWPNSFRKRETSRGATNPRHTRLRYLGSPWLHYLPNSCPGWERWCSAIIVTRARGFSGCGKWNFSLSLSTTYKLFCTNTWQRVFEFYILAEPTTGRRTTEYVGWAPEATRHERSKGLWNTTLKKVTKEWLMVTERSTEAERGIEC